MIGKIRPGYERDPMNKLAVQVFGEDKVDEMLNVRRANGAHYPLKHSAIFPRATRS